MYEIEPIVINLGNDLIAWIDPIDIELCQYDWRAKKAGSKEFPHYYAVRSVQLGSDKHDFYLHDEVWERMMNEPLPEGFLVDHKNRDKLDNRRTNLRLSTKTDNEGNKIKRRTHAGKRTHSAYKGVTKSRDRWRAIITYDKKTYNIGTFATQEEAAEAYNAKALELFGEFATLNSIRKKKETPDGN